MTAAGGATASAERSAAVAGRRLDLMAESPCPRTVARAWAELATAQASEWRKKWEAGGLGAESGPTYEAACAWEHAAEAWWEVAIASGFSFTPPRELRGGHTPKKDQQK